MIFWLVGPRNQRFKWFDPSDKGSGNQENFFRVRHSRIWKRASRNQKDIIIKRADKNLKSGNHFDLYPIKSYKRIDRGPFAKSVVERRYGIAHWILIRIEAQILIALEILKCLPKKGWEIDERIEKTAYSGMPWRQSSSYGLLRSSWSILPPWI